jgi:hypothetical protein
VTSEELASARASAALDEQVKQLLKEGDRLRGGLVPRRDDAATESSKGVSRFSAKISVPMALPNRISSSLIDLMAQSSTRLIRQRRRGLPRWRNPRRAKAVAALTRKPDGPHRR